MKELEDEHVSIFDQMEEFTTSAKSLLSARSRARSSWAVDGCVLRFRQTDPSYHTAWMRCRFLFYFYLFIFFYFIPQ